MSNNSTQTLQTVISIGAKIDNSLYRMGSIVEELGGQINAVSQKLIRFGSDALEVYKSYEDGILEVKAVLQDTMDAAELEAVMDSLEAKAQEWSASTIFHTDDVANALANAAHAGWDYEDMLEGIPTAMLLAQAGGLDLTQTVNDLSKVLKSTNTDFEDSGDLVGSWAKAANISATNIEEIGSALLQMGASARLSNSNEILTFLSELANTGTVGEKAGTAVRNMMIRLVAPTNKAAEAMEALDISEEEASEAMADWSEESEKAYQKLEAVGFSAYDSQGNLKGFISIFQDLNSALRKLPTEQEQNQVLNALFPTRTFSTARAMLDAAESGSLTETYRKIAGADQSYAEGIAETMMSGYTGKLELFKSKWEEVKRSVGESLADNYSEEVFGFLGGILDSINSMDASTMDTLVSFAVGIAAAGPAMVTAGGLLRLLGLVFTPTGAVTVGIAGAAALVAGLIQLDKANFEKKFGEMALDTEAISAHVSSIAEEYNGLYTLADHYGELLKSNLTKYEELRGQAASGLTTLLINGGNVTSEDKKQYLAYGEQMVNTLTKAIANSGMESEAYWSRTVDGQTYTGIAAILASNKSQQVEELESLGRDYREAVLGAFADGTLTSEEEAAIRETLRRMNEISAEVAKEAESDAAMAVQLEMQDKAMSVSKDSLDAVIQEIETARGEQVSAAEKRYNEEYYALYAKAMRDEVLTDEERAALEGAKSEGSQAIKSLKSKYDQMIITAYEQVIGQSDYGELWQFVESMTNTDGVLDIPSVYPNISSRDMTKLYDYAYEMLGKILGKSYFDIYDVNQAMTAADGDIKDKIVQLKTILQTFERYQGGSVGNELYWDEEAKSFGEQMSNAWERFKAYVSSNPLTVSVEFDGAEYDSLLTKSAAYRTGSGGKGTITRYAEGGRADAASIFGEAGPEWAIPEEHSANTARLLQEAAAASGFGWPSLYPGGGKSTTLVYSPTIVAADANGVEEKLRADKRRLEKWLREKKMMEEITVYA